MKKLLFTGMLLTSSLLQAETFRSRIHSIENGIIKFDNGRVAFTDLKSFDLTSDEYLRAEVDERSTLVSYQKLHGPMEENLKQFSFQTVNNAPPLFEPTMVQGMDEAWNIFNRSNPYYKRVSECTDRAHVWAHDEYKKTGIKSKKVFVFFTASYINSVRFKWWFHVAPLYTVNDNGTIKELVMDFRYSPGPQTVKEWTDQFVYTKRSCKVTTKFSEYDVNPQTENCYLIYESMHYKVPADIHEQELSGRYKSLTSESELKASYRSAFQSIRE